MIFIFHVRICFLGIVYITFSSLIVSLGEFFFFFHFFTFYCIFGTFEEKGHTSAAIKI